MITTLAVLVGGLGALARYELAGFVQRRTKTVIPTGTAVVNLLGALALGVLVGLSVEGTVGAAWTRVLGAGFLGGFTTFSTWMLEGLELGREGGRAGMVAAVVNVGGMLVVGVAMAGLAYGLGRLA